MIEHALHDPDTAGKSWKLAADALNMNGGDHAFQSGNAVLDQRLRY